MNESGDTTLAGSVAGDVILISDDREFPAAIDPTTGDLVCSVEVFAGATGWTLKPQGACRGDVCVPRAMLGAALTAAPDTTAPGTTTPDPPSVRIAALAAVLGIPTTTWRGEQLATIVVGHSAEDRGATVVTDRAPGFSLATLDGEQFEFVGSPDLLATSTTQRKRLLLAFASW